MTVGSHRRWSGGAAAIALVAAILLGACGSPAEARPTDPHDILVRAVGATAGLTTVRLHVEITSDLGGAINGQIGGPQGPLKMTMTIDADIDLPTRQLAGRSTMQTPQMVGANGGGAQVSDMIVTQAATFSRDAQTGRWMKMATGPNAGFGGGPSNVEIASMITKLLANPAVGLELREAAPCSLGTCDHVVAHVDGDNLAAALAPLIGAPIDVAAGPAIPDFEVDLLIDQATSVISEARTIITANGSSTTLLLALSNLGEPIQIAPPPPGLTDDFGVNMGGRLGGGTTTTILETVGGEVVTEPPSAIESPTAP